MFSTLSPTAAGGAHTKETLPRGISTVAVEGAEPVVVTLSTREPAALKMRMDPPRQPWNEVVCMIMVQLQEGPTKISVFTVFP